MGPLVGLMISFFMVTCVCGQGVDEQPVSSLPGPTELRELTGAALKVEALAKSEERKTDAVVRLCDLFAVIRLHPAYDQSAMLKSDSARIRRRLITTKEQWISQLKARRVVRPHDLTSRVNKALESASSDSKPVQARGGGAFQDQGWELVELIQQTIRPDFWDVAGGPGTIRYFAMRRVLVVRATTEVHEDLAALLRKL